MPTYTLLNGRLVDKRTGEPLVLSNVPIVSAPQVMKDSPGVVDPIHGQWLEGRAARREYMKRNDVVEVGDRPRHNGGYARNERFARKHGLPFEGDR